MWNPHAVRRLGQLPSWPVRSQHVARRNALLASTVLAQRRRERVEVEEFLRTLRDVRGYRHQAG
ncbi:MAG TPA: hypothetical protein VFG63_06495 [Nocardioidaceae bacterium]|nr:hypothetical protein [Nocardioidaceae bacterium]